jgi:hypothetical protein
MSLTLLRPGATLRALGGARFTLDVLTVGGKNYRQGRK